MSTIPKKDKFIRRITYHLYKDKIHDQTISQYIYKINPITDELNIDPFKYSKTMDQIRDVFLTTYKETLLSLFQEGPDFILVKIDKRNMSYFQQILP